MTIGRAQKNKIVGYRAFTLFILDVHRTGFSVVRSLGSGVWVPTRGKDDAFSSFNWNAKDVWPVVCWTGDPVGLVSCAVAGVLESFSQ
jgi:hypothetical protein